MNVQTKFRVRLFVLVLFFSSLSVVQGQTSVSCDSPPGGRISCERRQAAVCKVSEGKVYGECSTPGRGMTIDEIRAWILSAIFGKEVTVKEIRENPQYQRAIKEGRVDVKEAIFTFTLPDLSDNSPEPRDPSNPVRPATPEKPPTVRPTDPKTPSKPLILPKSPGKPEQ